MTDLVTRAQIDMLAETLGVPAEQLAHLGRFDDAQVRAINQHVSNAIFDAFEPAFKRIAMLAPLVPAGIAAKVSELAVPPICAGLAAGAVGVAHPQKAAAVLAKLSPTYAADSAPYLDPRAAEALAPVMPVEPLVKAAVVMVERGLFLTASRFVDFAPAELLQAAEKAIQDDAAMVRIAALSQSAARVAEIIAILPRERVQRIVRAGAVEPELRLDGLTVLARLDVAVVGELGEEVLGLLDDAELAGIAESALEADAVKEFLQMIAGFRAPEVARMASLAPVRDASAEPRFQAAAASDERAAAGWALLRAAL
jgi:hypothetical protein